MNKKKVPVLVGVGQLVNREKTPDQMDPLKMMNQAVRIAAKDAGISSLGKIDTLYVVNCLSKVLKNPCEEFSERLDCTPAETGYTGIGATAPQWFVNRVAERIYKGSSELALICGAEAFYTHGKALSLYEAMLDFFGEDRTLGQSSYVGDTRLPYNALEEQYGLIMPLTMYILLWKTPCGHTGRCPWRITSGICVLSARGPHKLHPEILLPGAGKPEALKK